MHSQENFVPLVTSVLIIYEKYEEECGRYRSCKH